MGLRGPMRQRGGYMDTRILKTGVTRLRFKLNPEAHVMLKKAINATGCKHSNTALENIFLYYITSDPGTATPIDKKCYDGNKRFLVRLYPEQLPVIMAGFDQLAQPDSPKENLLLHICKFFLAHFEE